MEEEAICLEVTMSPARPEFPSLDTNKILGLVSLVVRLP